MLDLEPCIHSLGLQSVSKLQWGAESAFHDITWTNGTTGVHASTNVSFPVSFPSTCFIALTTMEMNPNKLSGAAVSYVTERSASKFTVKWDEWSSTSVQSLRVNYIAVGK